jgi:hypothetical protein
MDYHDVDHDVDVDNDEALDGNISIDTALHNAHATGLTLMQERHFHRCLEFGSWKCQHQQYQLQQQQQQYQHEY